MSLRRTIPFLLIVLAAVYLAACAPVPGAQPSTDDGTSTGEPSRNLLIWVQQANQGTTAVMDGQVPHPLHAGDRLRVRRAACDFQLVQQPAIPKWYTLTQKLKWGQ